MDKYKYKRRQIRELQEDLQTMSNTMENLNRDESAYTEMIEEKEVIIEFIDANNLKEGAKGCYTNTKGVRSGSYKKICRP